MKYMEIAKDSDSPSEQAILEIANIVRNIAWLRATDVFGPIAYNSTQVMEVLRQNSTARKLFTEACWLICQNQ